MTVPYGFASLQARRFDVPEIDQINDVQAISALPDEFALLDGQPVVPTVWTSAEYLVSTSGVYYTERPALGSIHPGAFVRFIPDTETWDPIANVWSPSTSSALTRYQMNSDPLSAPVLDTTDYQIGREVIESASLDFGEGQLLTSDFNEGFDDAFAFTLAFACDLSVVDVPLVTFLDGSYIRATAKGMEARVGDHTFSVTVPQGVLALAPVYVVLQVAPPSATLTVAFSPTRLFRGSSPVTNRTTSFVFTVNGPMSLYGLDLWGDDAPSPTEIVSAYASVLGAN